MNRPQMIATLELHGWRALVFPGSWAGAIREKTLVHYRTDGMPHFAEGGVTARGESVTDATIRFTNTDSMIKDDWESVRNLRGVYDYITERGLLCP